MTGSKESLKFNKFEIYSNKNNKFVDVRSGIPRVEYRESVFTPYVMINVFVIETGNSINSDSRDGLVSILEGLTLQGTEKVLFEIEDQNGNKIKLTNNDDLRIASVSRVSQSFKNISYVLNIVSKEAYDNTLLETRVRTKLEGKISNVVKSILTDDLKSGRSVNVDETHNSCFDYGCDMSPFHTILKYQSLAIPDGMAKKSAGYLFWQTSNGYNFKSLDKLFETKDKKIKRYIENKKVDYQKVPAGFDDKILYSTINRTINALDQFETGAYGTVIEVFDEVTGEYVKSDPKTPPPEGTAEIAGTSLPQFNQEYRGKATDRILATKNTGGSFGSQDSLERQVEKFTEEDIVVEEILWQTKQNFRQKFNMSAEIVIPADFSLHAGDLVYCEFPELSTKSTLRGTPKDSGIYMISDLCHYGDKAVTYTGLHLVRDSFGIKR